MDMTSASSPSEEGEKRASINYYSSDNKSSLIYHPKSMQNIGHVHFNLNNSWIDDLRFNTTRIVKLCSLYKTSEKLRANGQNDD